MAGLRRVVFIAVCFVSVAVAALVRPAGGSELSKFLHAVFEEQQGRSPTGSEKYYYSNLSRSAGPLESYIAMVSSYDYYVIQCQRNAQVYITRLYQTFAGRDPYSDELRFWVNQFQASGTDRAAFVRRFCQANNIYSVPGAAPPARPSFRPPATPTAIADALVAKASLLGNLVRNSPVWSQIGQLAYQMDKTIRQD
jgi:hypothetical protein